MRKTRYYTCKRTGKRSFRTELDAKIALSSAQTRAQNTRIKGVERKRQEKRYYSCEHCSGYHLTSQDRRKKSA